MYEVKVQSSFSSAHKLKGYKGKCEELHGHNWKIEVSASSAELDSIGMVVDFKDIKILLNSVLQELDHKFLNDLECFSKINPTSENIAKYIHDKINGLDQGVKVNSVTVWETDTASATYHSNLADSDS